MAVEQPVDEMQIARPAASRAYGELAGQVSFGPGGEGCGFLVPRVNPGDRAFCA